MADFAEAHAEFDRLRTIEDAMNPDTRAEEDELDRACQMTTAALLDMLAIPAPGVAEAIMKVQAVRALYDVSSVPHLDPAVDELIQVITRQARDTVAMFERMAGRCPQSATDDIPDAPPHSLFKRIRAALVPWYDWGRWGLIRLDERGEGEVPAAQLDWLGLSIAVYLGRTPKAVFHG